MQCYDNMNRAKKDPAAWRNSAAGTVSYQAARAEAQDKIDGKKTIAEHLQAAE